jgi:hypothetical protein
VVDVYIILLLPTGEFFFLTPDGGLAETPQTLTPDGLAASSSAEVFRYTLSVVEPSGPYIWRGVLTAHDTTDIVSDIAQVLFLVE